MANLSFLDLFGSEQIDNNVVKIPKSLLANLGLDDFNCAACLRAALILNAAKTFDAQLAETDNVVLTVNSDTLAERGVRDDVLLIEKTQTFQVTSEEKLAYKFYFAFQENQESGSVSVSFLTQDVDNIYLDLTKLQATTAKEALFNLLNFYWQNTLENILVSKGIFENYFLLNSKYEVVFDVTFLVPSVFQSLFLEEILNG